jgi:hypothetical protein
LTLWSLTLEMEDVDITFANFRVWTTNLSF